MAYSNSPSTNIIRDANNQIDYLVTPNSKAVASQIFEFFKKGVRAFNLIGSYGTGKSSFLWALSQDLKGQSKFFNLDHLDDFEKVDFLYLIGESSSIIKYTAERIGLKDERHPGRILNQIKQEAANSSLYVILVDELGKFLEHAVENNPKSELYFLQQVAELANDPSFNILLISTLHQNFETYSSQLKDQKDRLEWRKVKGRYQELLFNEPVEQLLFLASQHFSQNNEEGPISFKTAKALSELIKAHNLFQIDDYTIQQVGDSLYPLDLISSLVLTKALQRFGQNERSLFTFLKSKEVENIEGYFHLGAVFDYLSANFYAELSSPSQNTKYRLWTSIQSAVERTEDLISNHASTSLNLIKIIGLLSFFGRKGAAVNEKMLELYCKLVLNDSKAKEALKELESKKIVLFSRFNSSYKIFEGTDLDFDEALSKAEKQVEKTEDIVPLLQDHFRFPVLNAKAISYKKGTPRLFQFEISNLPIKEIPTGPVDGFVNLIFNENLTLTEIQERSENQEEAILYGFYHEAKEIKENLFEIQKTKKVLEQNLEDLVAKRELENILKSREQLLSHYVIDSLFSTKVEWYFKGKAQKGINGKKEFNKLLSRICESVYPETPLFKNELMNRDKISTSIHTARKKFFKALVEDWQQEDLGFPKDNFPPEKTIYISLLKINGLHVSDKNVWDLNPPPTDNDFFKVWKMSEEFFETSRIDQSSIIELFKSLGRRPMKLKQGLVSFWVPTYLFIKRGDFALYREGVFVPTLNETILYEIARNPQDFSIKAFQIEGVRLKLFNKYREFLQQKDTTTLKAENFIESIKPFLIFYRGLNDYAKNTKMLSNEALALRNAIVSAKDPEKTFFEDFPAALKLTIEEIAETEESLSQFAQILNNSVDEIKDAYSSLLTRLESYLAEEILGETPSFPGYKNLLQSRYKSVKEHRLLKIHKTFLQRINSPLEDRDSWLASIFQAVIQKPLDQISDREENIAKEKLNSIIKELDNLLELSAIETPGKEAIRLELTTFENGIRSKNILIPRKKKEEIERLTNEIRGHIGKFSDISLAVLAKLIEENLKNE